jgi:hypothetical protein
VLGFHAQLDTERLRNVAVFLCFLPVQFVLAFGYANDISRGRGHLVFTSDKSNRINFCIHIDESAKRRFKDDSLDVQTRLALGMWVGAFSSAYRRVMSVARVDCASSSLNLLIDVGPEPPGSMTKFPANQRVINEIGRSYSRIRINTSFTFVLQGEPHGVMDFGALWTLLPDKSATLERFILEAQKSNNTLSKIADWADMDPLAIKASSLVLLTHEIGHAFGLCDTTLGEWYESCDRATLSPAGIDNQPDSVMQSNGELQLSEDDIQGLNALYTEYASKTP